MVVGILLAGWSSNSKWALFGGMRSAAQVVSYEIPAGLAIMVPVLMAGSLSMQEIIRAQGAWPWQWFLFTNPAALVAFVIFFIAQLAEGNRTPFDLPEAESELVAGYLSEYSGFRFAHLLPRRVRQPLGDGGDRGDALPRRLAGARSPAPRSSRRRSGTGGIPALAWWALQLASMVVFALKTLFVLNLIVWVRWTLPRIRVDQMMTLCWKYLVPFAFVGVRRDAALADPRRARAGGRGRRRAWRSRSPRSPWRPASSSARRSGTSPRSGDRVDLTNW